MISFLSSSLVRDNFYNISRELQSVNTFFENHFKVLISIAQVIK